MSIVATERGEYASARKYLQQALQLTNMSGDLSSKGNIYTNLGLNEHRARSFESAVSYLERGLQIFKSIGERALAARSMLLLAEVIREQGDLEHAERLYKRCLTLAREVGARLTECESLIGLTLLLKKSDIERANQYALKSIALANLIDRSELIERAQEASKLPLRSEG